MADAADNINNLKMHDNQHILKYNVEFNHLAVQTGWDDSVLCHHYYSGLAEQIKDIIGQQGKPPTLAEMKALAHAIDPCHWKHIWEKSCTNKPNNSSKPDSKKHNHQSSSNNNNSNSNQPQNSNKPKALSSSNSIANVLGKDSKLTPQERQRCFDNSLCMVCGDVGHMASNFPKSKSAKAKAL